MSTTGIRSDRSDKTIAYATAALAIRCAWNSDRTDIQDIVTTFERAIDGTVLRRLGASKSEHNDTVLRISCDCRYGPVYGACKHDLQRPLRRIVGALAPMIKVLDTSVLSFVRKEVSRAQLAAEVAEMQRAVDDLNTPLEVAERLSEQIVRLSVHLDEKVE